MYSCLYAFYVLFFFASFIGLFGFFVDCIFFFFLFDMLQSCFNNNNNNNNNIYLLLNIAQININT